MTALVIAVVALALLFLLRLHILTGRVQRLEHHTGLWRVADPIDPAAVRADDQLLDDLAALRRLPADELERLIAAWVSDTRDP